MGATGGLAKISASLDSSVDSSALDSWTDGNGRFQFSHLQNGDYNLEGILPRNGDTLVVAHRDVHFNGAVNLGQDTLQDPGLILIAAHWNGTPLQGVHCNLLGGSQAAVSDDSGRCLIAHVPPGLFQVRMTKEGFFSATSGSIRVQSDKFTDAGILNLAGLPEQVVGCWNVRQSNGYYGTLFVNGQGGNQTTDSVAWFSTVTRQKVTPGAGPGTDSVSQIYFALSYAGSSIIGYYWGSVKGDSLVNGISRSSEGDAASWFATRVSCPD